MYNHTFFDDVHVTMTTRTICSNNYFLLEYEEDKKENDNDNTMGGNDKITTKVACLLTEEKFGKDQNRRVHDISGLSPAIQTCSGGNREPKIIENVADPDKVVPGMSRDERRDTLQNYVVEMPSVLTKARTEEGRKLRREGIDDYAHKEYVPRKDGCSDTLTSVQKDNYVVEPSIVSRPHGFFDGAENIETSPSVTTSSFQENHFVKEIGNKNIDDMENNEGQKLNYRIRKLTPRECFRLMGVSEEDIDTIQRSRVSNSQQYKLAGNSIVVDVLEGIFRKLFIDKGPDKSEQLTLDI